MSKAGKVEVPREEYERLREIYDRMHAQSGRMSLRIPHDVYKALTERSAATGRGKTKIVLDALRTHLAVMFE